LTGSGPSPIEHKTNAEQAYQRSQYITAADLFRQAAAAYRSDGDLLSAAEMDNNAAVSLLQAAKPAEALALVEGTPQQFHQADDLGRAGRAYGNQGAALEALGRTAEAIGAYQAAVDLFTRTGDDEARGQTYQSLARVQLRQGQPIEAVTSMQYGLEGGPQPGFGQRLLRWFLGLPSRLLRR
jgi:tetratricopeptide (TPR) repeat protein